MIENASAMKPATDGTPAGSGVNRRQIIQAALATTTALALGACSTTQTSSGQMHAAAEPMSIDLSGDAWTMRQEDGNETLPATVPGSTYTDLLSAGKISNPYYRMDNGPDQWVAEKNWLYERTFTVSPEMLARPHVQLKCHGLDTLATLWINGQKLGTTDNMFRSWSFDIKPYIKPGNNQIRIRFATLEPTVRQLSSAYKAKFGINLPDPRSWIRKAPYMWGWDWCRPLLTQGIWKPIEIQAFESQIIDLGILQEHNPTGSVTLEIQARIFSPATGSRLEVTVLQAGKMVAHQSAPATDPQTNLSLTLASPKLWWPNGMGEHPLYTVVARLIGPHGLLDTKTQRIGLRKVEVLPPANGVAMHVQINGLPVFVKGADWVPADNLPTRVTPEIIKYYIQTAVQCNFNFIRLWGGGYYEPEQLFDLCDELGIMLQFEFKFANDTYPVHDTQWMDNLRAEVDEQVRRCRNHPSIVIWSGNNEIADFKGYYKLFRDVIGSTVHRLLPGSFYEVGSGAAGSGDIHTWAVWHGNAPVESYRQIEGFVTEFGMQSFPAPATVRTYTDAADRTSIHSPVMRYHELDGSGHGIGIIMHYTNMYFGATPDNFDSALWLTQINQAYAMRFGVEHWRRDMPRSMAATIWQFNDSWVGPTWSMIDYERRWKAVLYQSRHFFAPIMVSGIPNTKTGLMPLYITSDRQTAAHGELHWTVTNLSGAELTRGFNSVDIPPRSSHLACSLDFSDLLRQHGAENLLIWPRVVIDGLTVAENMLLFVRPVELKLSKPTLHSSLRGAGRQYQLTVTADAPALWFWADIPDSRAAYSDNFLHLYPGRPHTVYITLDTPLPHAEILRRLKLRSIYDIAPEMRKGFQPA